MKVEIETGFPEFNRLQKMLSGTSLLPVSLDYARKYERQWLTAHVKKNSEINVLTPDGNVLARFGPNSMESGNVIDIGISKEYLFGRNFPNFKLYCLKIEHQPKKFDTGKFVANDISIIQFYARTSNDEIEIANLGLSPISIQDYASKATLGVKRLFV